MPALDQKVIVDSTPTVYLTTPGGLILKLDPDDLPKNVREAIYAKDDAHAARALTNSTHCAVTVERRVQTTCRHTLDGKGPL